MRTRFLIGCLLGVAACGGGGAKPASNAQPEPADAAPSSVEESVANAAAAANEASGGADAGPAAPSPAPSASALPPGVSETPATDEKDECTPAGVDFEKRARPKLRECYRAGKKKDPDLKGTVRISVDVSIAGKITSTKITEKTLPDPVAQCMLKVVKTTPFPEASKCPGKSITIPMTFPTPH